MNISILNLLINNVDYLNINAKYQAHNNSIDSHWTEYSDLLIYLLIKRRP